MEEVIISREAYEKMVTVLEQIPYGQIKGLLAEVYSSARPYEQDKEDK